MARAKPVVLSTRSFSKRGDAVLFFRAMLARYRDGDTVSGEDEADLRALLNHHPERDEKIGPGVDHFRVDENTLYAPVTRCFWIVRQDGSTDDFAVGACLRNAPQS